MTGEPRPLERARELFATFLAGAEDGEAPSFEALVAEHPELANELGRLHEGW